MFAGRKETMKEKNNCPTVKAEDCTISFNDEYVLISHKKIFFKKYLTMEEHEKLYDSDILSPSNTLLKAPPPIPTSAT